MKQFSVPILPIRVERDTDSKMQTYEVSGIELEYIPGCTAGRNLFTGAFFAGGTDGLAVSFCAEAPHAKAFAQRQYDSYTREGLAAQRNAVPPGFTAKRRSYKGKVFEDDCLELFIRPADSDVYYGWEINACGACLDYRAGVGESGLKAVSVPNRAQDGSAEQRDGTAAPDAHRKVCGRKTDRIEGIDIHFDYDWQSRAQWRMECEDGFWYLELFVPWSDFGMSEPPVRGTVWYGTINRIDAGVYGRPHVRGESGLQCLLDFADTDAPAPRFHQPQRFAAFEWLPLPKKNTGGTSK